MVTIASMTSTPEELEHAAGPNWREPFIPKEVQEVKQDPVATEETPKAETAPESETGKTESEKPKRRPHWEKRIDTLTYRNARLEEEIRDLRAKLEKPAETQAQPQDQPPQLKDYKTPEEWADARDAWKEAKAEREAQAAEAKEISDAYQRNLDEVKAEYDDWEEVFDEAERNKIVISPKISEAIIESGRPEVAYYLAKHPEELEKLEDMRKTAAAARIYEIAKEMSPSAKNSPKKEKPKAKPPEPIATVGASSAQSSVPLDQLSMKDYIKARNRQERERRSF